MNLGVLDESSLSGRYCARFKTVAKFSCNTADPDCDMSPAEIALGNPSQDTFSFVNCLSKFTNCSIRRTWHEAWRAKEDTLRLRAVRNVAALHRNSRPLGALHCGDRAFLQNQTGNHTRKWDKVGTVVETLGFDQYAIKVGRSGRITKHNRRFLRPNPTAAHDTTPFDPGAPSIPIPSSSPEALSRGSAVCQDPQTPPITTLNNHDQQDPSNTNVNHKSCSTPSVASGPNQRLPDVLEPLTLTDMGGASACPTVRCSNCIRRPTMKLDPTNGLWVKKGSTSQLWSGKRTGGDVRLCHVHLVIVRLWFVYYVTVIANRCFSSLFAVLVSSRGGDLENILGLEDTF